MKHTILTFTLFIFSCINVFAYDFTAICETGQELAYTINEDKETVCVYKNSTILGELIIPANVEYDSQIYRVTSIGGSAFMGLVALTSITIPGSVTSIEERAFCGCSGLTSVSIPMGVTSIGERAFCECSGLTSVSIPTGVTSIGYYAFYGCSALTSIIVEEGNTAYDSRNNCNAIIETKTNTLIAGCNNTTIPIGVTSIGNCAFYGCSNLTSITIPEGVTSIGNSAFNGCSRLTSITIPESVTSIGSYAFEFTHPKEVTCYAIIPPKTYDCFGISSIRYLYIPCESKEDYVTLWGGCAKYVECINTGTVDLLTKDEVVVEPRKTEAMFSMPKNENANSYTLTISNNDVTLCTLTFNAQGQLANIDLSTSKSYELKLGIAGFQFTVIGLSTASKYEYSFKVFGENPKDPRKICVLKEYTGSFTTQNEDGTGGSVQGGGEVEGSGQGGEGGEGGPTAVSEVSNATAVTVVNSQILVNGEAPAFVVTVSGKKIANQNLKSGVYFVVVDGETVKVVMN